MPALQRGAAWAEERLSGALRQSVPQNGRVHLHIVDVCNVFVGNGILCEFFLAIGAFFFFLIIGALLRTSEKL